MTFTAYPMGFLRTCKSTDRTTLDVQWIVDITSLPKAGVNGHGYHHFPVHDYIWGHCHPQNYPDILHKPLLQLGRGGDRGICWKIRTEVRWRAGAQITVRVKLAIYFWWGQHVCGKHFNPQRSFPFEKKSTFKTDKWKTALTAMNGFAQKQPYI